MATGKASDLSCNGSGVGSALVTPWRFLEDIPLAEAHHRPPAAGSGLRDDDFVLGYLISKLGDLELEIADLESLADTVDDHLALQRLTAARDNLAEAADEVIFRRAPLRSSCSS